VCRCWARSRWALLLFNGAMTWPMSICGRGTGKTRRTLCTIDRTIEEWRRGEQVQLEIPSYELPTACKPYTWNYAAQSLGRPE